MKKPGKEKKVYHSLSCRYGTGTCFGCEYIGYNKGLDKMEAYHNWDLKENYIRKPSVEKIERILKKDATVWVQLMEHDIKRVAKAIIKELEGK